MIHVAPICCCVQDGGHTQLADGPMASNVTANASVAWKIGSETYLHDDWAVTGSGLASLTLATLRDEVTPRSDAPESTFAQSTMPRAIADWQKRSRREF